MYLLDSSVHYETRPSITATVPLLNASSTSVMDGDVFSSNTFSSYSNSLQLCYFSVPLEFWPAKNRTESL